MLPPNSNIQIISSFSLFFSLWFDSQLREGRCVALRYGWIFKPNQDLVLLSISFMSSSQNKDPWHLLFFTQTPTKENKRRRYRTYLSLPPMKLHLSNEMLDRYREHRNNTKIDWWKRVFFFYCDVTPWHPSRSSFYQVHV